MPEKEPRKLKKALTSLMTFQPKPHITKALHRLGPKKALLQSQQQVSSTSYNAPSTEHQLQHSLQQPTQHSLQFSLQKAIQECLYPHLPESPKNLISTFRKHNLIESQQNTAPNISSSRPGKVNTIIRTFSYDYEEEAYRDQNILRQKQEQKVALRVSPAKYAGYPRWLQIYNIQNMYFPKCRQWKILVSLQYFPKTVLSMLHTKETQIQEYNGIYKDYFREEFIWDIILNLMALIESGYNYTNWVQGLVVDVFGRVRVIQPEIISLGYSSLMSTINSYSHFLLQICLLRPSIHLNTYNINEVLLRYSPYLSKIIQSITESTNNQLNMETLLRQYKVAIEYISHIKACSNQEYIVNRRNINKYGQNKMVGIQKESNQAEQSSERCDNAKSTATQSIICSSDVHLNGVQADKQVGQDSLQRNERIFQKPVEKYQGVKSNMYQNIKQQSNHKHYGKNEDNCYIGSSNQTIKQQIHHENVEENNNHSFASKDNQNQFSNQNHQQINQSSEEKSNLVGNRDKKKERSIKELGCYEQINRSNGNRSEVGNVRQKDRKNYIGVGKQNRVQKCKDKVINKLQDENIKQKVNKQSIQVYDHKFPKKIIMLKQSSQQNDYKQVQSIQYSLNILTGRINKLEQIEEMDKIYMIQNQLSPVQKSKQIQLSPNSDHIAQLDDKNINDFNSEINLNHHSYSHHYNTIIQLQDQSHSSLYSNSPQQLHIHLNSSINHFGLIYYNQGFYQGQSINALMDGFGTLYYAHSSIAYRGEWKLGKFHGKGILYHQLYHSNKQQSNPTPTLNPLDLALSELNQYWLKYQGMFDQDKKQGFGAITYKYGTFKGRFQANWAEGWGVLKWGDQQLQGIWSQDRYIASQSLGRQPSQSMGRGAFIVEQGV